MGYEELAAGAGHWIFAKDIGWPEFNAPYRTMLGAEAAGAISAAMKAAAPAEQFFKLHPDGKSWEIRYVNWATKEDGRVGKEVYTGEWSEEATIKNHENQDMVGQVKMWYDEDGSMVAETKGTLPKLGFQHMECRRSVVDGEFILSYKDHARDGISATRIFRRYPNFILQNNTGETLAVSLYHKSDMVCMVAAKTVDTIGIGDQYLAAASSEAEEEYAIFSTDSGKQKKLYLKVDEKVILNKADFE